MRVTAGLFRHTYCTNTFILAIKDKIMTDQSIVKSENPFGNPAPVAADQGNAVAESDAVRSIEEVRAALVIAKQFPRNPMEAMEKILNACTRPTLAETALYSYPKGGQEVTGPSIRLAEAMAQNWGNMQFGIRELSQSNGVSNVEAFAWDVETNTRQTKTFQVKHERHTRKGVKKLTDTRDIYELVANQGARRLRACILGVIPGDVTEAAVNQVSVTQAANIDTSPDAIKKMLEIFDKKFGISQELIEKRIGMRAESVRPAQMQSLLNIANSIREGMSKPHDWFDIGEVSESPEPQKSDLTSQLTKQEDKTPKTSIEEQAAIIAQQEENEAKKKRGNE